MMALGSKKRPRGKLAKQSQAYWDQRLETELTPLQIPKEQELPARTSVNPGWQIASCKQMKISFNPEPKAARASATQGAANTTALSTLNPAPRTH
jgi:hypothetical protein